MERIPLHLPNTMELDDLLSLEQQIQKDLLVLGVLSINNPSLDALVVELSYILEYGLEKSSENLFQALYRVDIPDEKVKAVLIGSNPVQGLTQLVLLRCYQKITLRKMMSK